MVATPASTAASRTPTAWTVTTAAATVIESGLLLAGGDDPPGPPRLVGGGDPLDPLAALACARARAFDREPTCYLHDPAAPGCHRVGPSVRCQARSRRDTLPGPRHGVGIGCQKGGHRACADPRRR